MNDVLQRIRDELAELRRLVEAERLRSGPLTYSYEAAAKQLGISERTLRRMVARQQISTVLVGKVPKVPVSELRRLASMPAPVKPTAEAARAARRAAPRQKAPRASMGEAGSEVAKLRALRKARR